MNIDSIGLELAKIMSVEAELLNKLSVKEAELQKALYSGNWEMMERNIDTINPLSDAVEKIEEERNKKYLKLKNLLEKPKETNFYSIALCLSGQSRETCLCEYRKLKIALLRMQGITYGINQYVKTVGETTKAVLDEVFPHRRGNLYLRSGNSKPVSSDPMILSKSL